MPDLGGRAGSCAGAALGPGTRRPPDAASAMQSGHFSSYLQDLQQGVVAEADVPHQVNHVVPAEGVAGVAVQDVGVVLHLGLQVQLGGHGPRHQRTCGIKTKAKKRI